MSSHPVISCILLSLCGALSGLAAARQPLTCAADLNAAIWSETPPALQPFSLCGTLVHQLNPHEFVFKDATGHLLLHLDPGQSPRAGDIVEIAGHISDQPSFCHEVWSKSLTVVGHTNTPAVVTRPLHTLRGRDCQALPVITDAFVEEAFRDEVDPGWIILLLRDGTATLPASVRDDESCANFAARLFGRHIRLLGVCLYNLKGERRYTGLRLVVADPRSVSFVDDADDSGLDVPMLAFDRTDPASVVAQGRRRVIGTIVTAWCGNRILLETDGGELVRADLVRGQIVPPIGTCVEATGNAETDLLHVNLAKARLRPLAQRVRKSPGSSRRGAPLAAADIFQRHKTDASRALDGQAFGRTVRTRGRVVSPLPPDAANTTFDILSDGILIPVDAGNCPEIRSLAQTGATVELSGICVFETENWHPGNPFPRITGFRLVLNSARDFTVIDIPPWWTTRRLSIVLGVLFTTLVMTCVWIVLLRRAVERRTRELENEIIARIGSDFKMHERTRLAVDLHDAISQNLTGIALELKTARRLARNPDAMDGHLLKAERALASCREELKNCIWDLRSRALDEPDLNKAVRETLEPHLGGAVLITRLAVPRERLSENTAHALLRILRELATNAVRHGQATVIRIAGCIEDGNLHISVRDNGHGFRTDDAPGVESGHFGLEGVRERIDTFAGTLAITSAPAQGTRINIALPVPEQEDA